MKKIFFGSMLLVLTMSVASAHTWSCSGYINGKYKGVIKIKFADNEDEAKQKAYRHFRDDLNIKVTSTSCYVWF